MTVMNNTFIETTPNFSEVEIGAARNAFLQYEQKQQLHLLTIMPIDEAVGILQHCSVGYVNSLIAQLEQAGYDKRARHYAHQLGLHMSEVDTPDGYLSTSVLEHVKQRIGWIIALALLGIVSGLIIAQYEDTLSQLVLLAVYMPVIAAAGGNTGNSGCDLSHSRTRHWRVKETPMVRSFVERKSRSAVYCLGDCDRDDWSNHAI